MKKYDIWEGKLNHLSVFGWAMLFWVLPIVNLFSLPPPIPSPVQQGAEKTSAWYLICFLFYLSRKKPRSPAKCISWWDYSQQIKSYGQLDALCARCRQVHGILRGIIINFSGNSDTFKWLNQPGYLCSHQQLTKQAVPVVNVARKGAACTSWLRDVLCLGYEKKMGVSAAERRCMICSEHYGRACLRML